MYTNPDLYDEAADAYSDAAEAYAEYKNDLKFFDKDQDVDIWESWKNYRKVSDRMKVLIDLTCLKLPVSLYKSSCHCFQK